MLIVFEGIDGSGKTTLSNRVARRLRAAGHDVLHLREGGELGSRVSGAVRALARDQRHLTLSDRAELLLYCAREAQLVDELLRPALRRGSIVIGDRSIYSHLALGAAGRGLRDSDVRSVLDFTVAGRWPDLVVLVDAAPAVAKARKRARKVTAADAPDAEPPPLDGSRKGLAGDGLTLRVRDALLQLSARDPARWLVVDNTQAELSALEDRVLRAILHRLSTPAEPSRPGAAQLRLTAPRPPRRTLRAAAPVNPAALAERFHDLLEPFADREPAVALSFVSGLSDERADALRERLALVAPAAVAQSLSGLDTPTAWRLRRALASRAPHAVAKSLDALAPEAAAQVDAMRAELLDEAPRAVLSTYTGDDGDDAWRVRERLMTALPYAVLRSVAGLGSERAWSLRDEQSRRLPGDEALSLALIESVSGLDDDRAWQVRDELGPALALGLVRSLRGTLSPRAWKLRDQWAPHATKAVLRTVMLVDDPRAWKLRARWLPRAPEALDGFEGHDSPEAWRLRDEGAAQWPARTVRSLGALAHSGRGADLLWRVVRQHPEDLDVMRAALRCLQTSASEPALQSDRKPVAAG